jgi:hypothetical protein
MLRLLSRHHLVLFHGVFKSLHLLFVILELLYRLAVKLVLIVYVTDQRGADRAFAGARVDLNLLIGKVFVAGAYVQVIDMVIIQVQRHFGCGGSGDGGNGGSGGGGGGGGSACIVSHHRLLVIGYLGKHHTSVTWRCRFFGERGGEFRFDFEGRG